MKYLYLEKFHLNNFDTYLNKYVIMTTKIVPLGELKHGYICH